jgi:hypothetical protein
MKGAPFKNVVSITELTLPQAMIDGIRRRFGRSIDRVPWNADQELKPELDHTAELPTDTAVLIAATAATGATSAIGEFSPADENAPDYYRSLVATAIENGGKHGDHQMSIPWLRMILAGLESKQIEPDMMWHGVESGGAGGEPLPEIPPYDDFFPAERNVPTGPGPR